MGVSALLMFLSLNPEQHFNGVKHPLMVALLVFCGVYAAYRLSDLKPSLQLRPLRFKLGSFSPDFIIAVLLAATLLILACPGYQFILQFGMAGLIAVSYYTISASRHQTFGGLRSIYLIKNLSLACAWALTTAPVHPGEEGMLFHFAERFFFLLALSLLIDLRDINTDKANSIHTLAGTIGTANTRLLAVTLLAGAILLSVFYSYKTGDYSLLNAAVFSYFLTILSAFFLNNGSTFLTFLVLVDGNLLLHGILTFFFKRL